jgi:hypothetical protein
MPLMTTTHPAKRRTGVGCPGVTTAVNLYSIYSNIDSSSFPCLTRPLARRLEALAVDHDRGGDCAAALARHHLARAGGLVAVGPHARNEVAVTCVVSRALLAPSALEALQPRT